MCCAKPSVRIVGPLADSQAVNARNRLKCLWVYKPDFLCFSVVAAVACEEGCSRCRKHVGPLPALRVPSVRQILLASLLSQAGISVMVLCAQADMLRALVIWGHGGHCKSRAASGLGWTLLALQKNRNVQARFKSSKSSSQ